VAHVGLYEVAGDFWRDGEKTAVADRGYLLDVPVMVLNKSQVCEKGSEILPAREGFGVDHDTTQLPIGLNIRIDFLRDLLKVYGLQRAGWPDNQDSFVFQKFVVDHGKPRVAAMYVDDMSAVHFTLGSDSAKDFPAVGQ
jgi:hypothetical protein